MLWLLVLLAVAVGMIIPLQPGVNAELRTHLGNPLLASWVSFAGGLVCLTVFSLAARAGLPSASAIASAPWWAWFGGALGAAFVTVTLILAPRLGAVLLVGSVVTGQLLGSVVVDRFGLVGFPKEPVTPLRLLGVGLLLAGVVVVQLGAARTPEERSDQPADQPPGPALTP